MKFFSQPSSTPAPGSGWLPSSRWLVLAGLVAACLFLSEPLPLASGQPPAETESGDPPATEASAEEGSAEEVSAEEANPEAVSSEAAAATGADTPAQASAWTELILDDSLMGWVQLGGNASFTIQRNEIIGMTRPGIDDGFLCTETEYENFELEMECKVDPGLNSGIVIRGQLASDAPRLQVEGCQVEIDSSPRAWTGSLYDQAERTWLATVADVPEAREAFQPTQWNRLRIVAAGPRVRTWVNDVPAVDYARVKENAGFIGLQMHRTRLADGLEVRWRRLRIRAVSEPAQTDSEAE